MCDTSVHYLRLLCPKPYDMKNTVGWSREQTFLVKTIRQVKNDTAPPRTQINGSSERIAVSCQDCLKICKTWTYLKENMHAVIIQPLLDRQIIFPVSYGALSFDIWIVPASVTQFSLARAIELHMPVSCQNGLKTWKTDMCMKENMHAVGVQPLSDRQITFPVRY